MEAVGRDRSLQSLATDAFRSSIRAYAAYPAAVKEVFHVKKLHLGHVAHSFALRCTPAPQAATSRHPHAPSLVCGRGWPKHELRSIRISCREAPSTFGRSAHKEELKRKKRAAHAGKSTKRSKQK